MGEDAGGGLGRDDADVLVLVDDDAVEQGPVEHAAFSGFASVVEVSEVGEQVKDLVETVPGAGIGGRHGVEASGDLVEAGADAFLLALEQVQRDRVGVVGLDELDLSRGSEPTSVHGLAAVYLGFSVGFGHYIISRADVWFAHRFADGPRPSHPPRTGPARVRHEWQDWLRVLTAWAIAVPALLIMKAFSGWSLPSSMEEFWTDELWSWVARLTLINIAWLLTGPVYTTIFKSRYVPEESETRIKENA